jgi:hypothetical protein
MPRGGTVNTTYAKARRTPSDREIPSAFFSDLREPTGGSALARYLIEEADSGLETFELIRQFQEYDCDHTRQEVIAMTKAKLVRACSECGKMTTRNRSWR